VSNQLLQIICRGKFAAKKFRTNLGKFRQNILRTPTNCLLLHLWLQHAALMLDTVLAISSVIRKNEV